MVRRLRQAPEQRPAGARRPARLTARRRLSRLWLARLRFSRNAPISRFRPVFACHRCSHAL